MSYQSLYRRFRPSRFAEVRGQDHITVALRNAVRTDTVGHAYMFSGPRGCGKTSSARILARALNCTNLADGEPCGVCDSCVAMESGTSMDLHELDAASNNGVDAMRDLVSRAALGTAGRNKVYILDEVHMLTGAASNALLKTLEEPPPHVTFVLATTDPQKVLPTIKSRTQHFNFELLSPHELENYVRWVIAEAELTVDDEAIAYVVRQGRGSARDTLSSLDQVVAGGGVVPREEPSANLVSALTERDTGAALTAVADALGMGSDPRVLAEALVADLRDLFLLTMGVEGANVADADREELTDRARRFGPARLTRALEQLGSALVDMRQASDPRVPLEVALVRLTAPTADLSIEALAERVEALERALAGGAVSVAHTT
ncbi:MAG: DNA polymerase III subunit gamma/tau, partial [Candidatus Microthrix subdominans]